MTVKYSEVEKLAKSVDITEKDDGSVELTLNFKDDQTEEEVETIKEFLLKVVKLQRCKECEDSYTKNDELYCELKEMPVNKIDCPMEV